jgi:transmembrane sensor
MIKQKISRLEGNTSVKGRNKIFDIRIYLKIAASVILMLSIGFALYEWRPFGSLEEQSHHQVKTTKWFAKATEKGQKFTIFLGDGTKVRLNSESSLQYPSNFSDSNRVVHLTGEAFFEIERDPLRPFSVISNDLVTTALGTAFNVNAFPDQNQIIISLAEGIVKINLIEVQNESDHSADFELLLEPGRQAIYSTIENTMHTKDFNVRKELSWKDGVIYFEDDTWKTIVNTLERWYGVEFEVRNQTLIDKLYTGSCNNESLKNVLESLGFSKNFEFRIEEKKVYINFK